MQLLTDQPMSFVKCLQGKQSQVAYDITPRTLCDQDFSPVEVMYDYDAMRGKVTRESIEAGPKSLWRYRDLLPLDGEPKAGLRSGWTPLVKADRLAAELGVKEIWIKDDSANYPSYSYKDRVVAVAISKAIEFGFGTVGCASTGNLAHSVAAHAAIAGLPAYVMVPHDLEAAKYAAMQVFGAKMIRINGNYDDVNRLCSQIADKHGWGIVNVNLRPFYTEGAKTFGHEIAEQLGWRLPGHTVMPVAGGTILPKLIKGYREFIDLGLVEDRPFKVHASQAAGCNPVAKAIEAGQDWFDPQKPDTIAKSIAIGNPADGDFVISDVKATGGSAASNTDDKIIEAIRLLARTEGIFTEPAGGNTLAGAIQLIERGIIKPDESVVVGITGNGLKTIECLEGQFSAPAPIEAKMDAFDSVIG